MFRGLYAKAEGLYWFTWGYFILWPLPSVWQTHTENVPGGSWQVLWEVKWVGVTLFCPGVSPGEITLKFMLLFLCELFAMETGVYHVLLCSIVDIKGSIKLPLLIGKLKRNIKGEVQDAFFSLPSKSLLHGPNKQTAFREAARNLPRLKAHVSPVGSQQGHKNWCGFCTGALQWQETCLWTIQVPAFWRLTL